MESTWICLFVALFAESCASTTAHQCNDFNLRLDPENADSSWGFYNFTNVDIEGGCFICVELHSMSNLSRLIVPCPPAGVADITVSWFSFWVDDSVHFGTGELRDQSQNMDCHSKYESANASQFIRSDIQLENSSLTAAAIDEMSKEFNFPTPMPDRLYTIFTDSQFVTSSRTACIRNVTYTYLATTSSTGNTSLSQESSTERPTSAYLVATSSAGDRSLSQESSTEIPTSDLPIWIIAVIATVGIFVCVLLGCGIIRCRNWTRYEEEDEHKGKDIIRDDDNRGSIYNPVYSSGGETNGHPGDSDQIKGSEELDPGDGPYEGVGEGVENGITADSMIYNHCYEGFNVSNDKGRSKTGQPTGDTVYEDFEEGMEKGNNADCMIYNDCYEGFNVTNDKDRSKTGQPTGGIDHEGFEENRKRVPEANGNIGGCDNGPEVKNVRWSLQNEKHDGDYADILQ